MSKSIKLQDNVYWDQSSIKHDIIKVRATVNQSKTDVGALEITYGAVDYNIGNSFELSSGKVKVKNSNIHHVKVHSVTWVERGGESYAWYYIRKNKTNIGTYMIPRNNNGDSWQSVAMTTICDVTVGDLIYASVYFNIANANNRVAGGYYTNSVYLIVEAID